MKHEREILRAALRQLNDDPAATMAELAEAIGISRATLHRHFASREALLRALGELGLDRWELTQREAGMAAATTSGDAAQLAAALRKLLGGFAADAVEYGFTLTDHFITNIPELAARADAIEQRELAFYAAAQRAGVLRADLPVRWVSNTTYGLMIAARDGLRRGDIARRDLEQVLLTTFLHGAGNRGDQ